MYYKKKKIELGHKPSLEVIKEYMASEKPGKFPFTAEEFYNYYDARDWSTRTGSPLVSLETSVGSFIWTYNHLRKSERKKLSQPRVIPELPPIAQATCELMNERNPNEMNNAASQFISLVKRKKKVSKKGSRGTTFVYDNELKDPRWKAFRQFVFTVRGYKCEICGATEGVMNIHHLRYIKGRCAWEYTCNDVIVVCPKCHDRIHKIAKSKKPKHFF